MRHADDRPDQRQDDADLGRDRRSRRRTGPATARGRRCAPPTTQEQRAAERKHDEAVHAERVAAARRGHEQADERHQHQDDHRGAPFGCRSVGRSSRGLPRCVVVPGRAPAAAGRRRRAGCARPRRRGRRTGRSAGSRRRRRARSAPCARVTGIRKARIVMPAPPAAARRGGRATSPSRAVVQAQRVGDDEDRGRRHRQRGDQRRDQPGDRQRDRDAVVERPPSAKFCRTRRAARRAIRCAVSDRVEAARA